MVESTMEPLVWLRKRLETGDVDLLRRASSPTRPQPGLSCGHSSSGSGSASKPCPCRSGPAPGLLRFTGHCRPRRRPSGSTRGRRSWPMTPGSSSSSRWVTSQPPSRSGGRACGPPRTRPPTSLRRATSPRNPNSRTGQTHGHSLHWGDNAVVGPDRRRACWAGHAAPSRPQPPCLLDERRYPRPTRPARRR